MWKIQSCEVCEFCILLYYARKSVTTFRAVCFPAVLMNFPNSKVCLIGEWSIVLVESEIKNVAKILAIYRGIEIFDLVQSGKM